MSSNAEQVRAWRAAKKGTTPPYHGSRHIYDAYGCRCDECRADAARVQRRKYWARRP